jgi:AhpD family alkylhydroperoxidase
MRLEPIEKPRDWSMRLAYLLSRRMLGKVMTPLKVVGARSPRVARAQYALARAEQNGLVLDPELKLLLKTWVATLNGCAFCIDIGKALAVKERV